MFPRVVLVAVAAMLGVEHGPRLIRSAVWVTNETRSCAYGIPNVGRGLTMTTIRSTRLGVLLSIPLLAGLGSTGAQAYDPRVTTRPSDLMGGRSPRVVRDHRYPSVRATTGPHPVPIVRDHRTPGPIVRDHRTSATGPCRSCATTGHPALSCPTTGHLARSCATTGHPARSCATTAARMVRLKVG